MEIRITWPPQVRPLPPHPGPLPKGEGESSAVRQPIGGFLETHGRPADGVKAGYTVHGHPLAGPVQAGPGRSVQVAGTFWLIAYIRPRGTAIANMRPPGTVGAGRAPPPERRSLTGLWPHAGCVRVPLTATILMAWTSKAGCKPALRCGGSAEKRPGRVQTCSGTTNGARYSRVSRAFAPGLFVKRRVLGSSFKTAPSTNGV